MLLYCCNADQLSFFNLPQTFLKNYNVYIFKEPLGKALLDAAKLKGVLQEQLLAHAAADKPIQDVVSCRNLLDLKGLAQAELSRSVWLVSNDAVGFSPCACACAQLCSCWQSASFCTN